MAIVVTDTSVLINFLKIDRMDLVGSHPAGFLATDHVRDEISDRYPAQIERYAAAIKAGWVSEEEVVDPAEVALFGRLTATPRLGPGECSAIAVALNRHYSLAIDDGRAIRHALREAGLTGYPMTILRTQDVIVELIRANVLTISQADELKAGLEAQHRFRIAIRSFADLL
jgi:predicted nucleic acid-binding protein